MDDLDATVWQVRSAIFELDAHWAPGHSLRCAVLDVAGEAARALGFDPWVTFDGPVDAAVSTRWASTCWR